MERLTERERNVDGTGVAKEEITDGLLKPFADKILTKLADYEDLEEQGLLVRLPCKVGNSVFIIVGKDISRQGIRKIEISDNSIIFKTNRQKRIFNVAEFGKTVFLTREEAEKMLEEMKNEWLQRKSCRTFK